MEIQIQYWLNLWRQHTAYIYLVTALYRVVSNTLHNVCTIHSMWKSQKFLKQSNIENSFCAPTYPSWFPLSPTLNNFLDKYTYALWPLLYFGIQHHRSVWVSFLWHCFSNFLKTWTCNRFSVFERISNIAMIWYISIPSSESNANVTSAPQCSFFIERREDSKLFLLQLKLSQISERAITCVWKNWTI